MAEMVDCYSCKFVGIGKSLSISIEHICIDFKDDYELDKKIAQNEYFINFDKTLLPMSVTSTDWSEDDKILTINDIKYQVISDNLVYLANDIGIKHQTLLNNIIKNYRQYLEKNS